MRCPAAESAAKTSEGTADPGPLHRRRDSLRILSAARCIAGGIRVDTFRPAAPSRTGLGGGTASPGGTGHWGPGAGPLSSPPVRRILPPEYRAHLERRGDAAAAATGPAVTFRSLAVGLAFCLVIAVCVPYGSMLIRGSRMGLSSSTPAAFFALFLLLLFIQPLLRGLHAGWALRRGELIVVFFMMMVASAIPTRGVMGMLLPMISGHDYYATPENRWEELVHPPPAGVDGGQRRGGGAAVLRGRRRRALGVLAPGPGLVGRVLPRLYLAQLCALVLLRRQWVDRERLAFPLAQVPMAMLEGAGRRWLPPFFTNPLTWIGMSIPLAVNLTNGLSKYNPVFPSLRLSDSILVFGISLDLSVNFLILGFSYLIGSSVSMGLWFFYLLHRVQDRVFHLFGIRGYEQEVGDWSSRASATR